MNWKIRKLFIISLLLTYLLVLSTVSTNFATGVEYNAPYRSGIGPFIDGNITASEWVNANKTHIVFQFNDTGNPSIEADLYLLHNGSALFIGINVTLADQHNDTDAFFIYFDENNDEQLKGNSTNPNEEGLTLYRNGTYTDLSFNGSEWISDLEIENLTQGPSYGAVINDEWEFVFWPSENSSDFDVNLPSNVVERALELGFDIEYYDADISQYDSFTTPTNGTVNLTPSLWDNLICDAVPSSPPNILNIWLYIIIAMILPAGLIVFLMVWIKNKKLD